MRATPAGDGTKSCRKVDCARRQTLRSMRLMRRAFGNIAGRKRSRFRSLLLATRRRGSKRKFGEQAAMKGIIGAAIIAVGLVSGSMFGATAAYASSDAPWCAVTQLGE